MGKIILLDELTSSQIAAGEVVERPSSVVKEMVENSIDAGSTRISIEIRKGGIKYIRIDDNGTGMEPDDCVIAFDKHATSKIKSSQDLANINTLGFRGEALASIAAVSKVTLRTKTKDQTTGTYVVIEGGDLVESGACGARDGTSFTVENLFYNTPARYKFLMRDQTEASYCAEVVEKIALSHPDISFRLVSDKKQILFTPGGDLNSAVYGIYGKDVSEKLRPFDHIEENVRVSGLCGVKELTYGNRGRQTVFVNGRYIKSKTVFSAIDEAYKTFTMKGRFPFVILNIDLPVQSVDVNVHPAKTEVRFADNNLIFRVVYRALSSALYETRELNTFTISGGYDANETSPAKEFSPLKETFSVKESAPSTNESGVSSAREPEPVYIKTSSGTEDIKPVDQTDRQPEDLSGNADRGYILPGNRENMNSSSDRRYSPKVQSFFEGLGIEKRQDTAERPVSSDPSFSDENCNVYRFGRLIGTLFDTYILIEYDSTFYMIDQHAAHERLKYEEIKAALENLDNPQEPLLLPITVRLGASEMIRFREVLPALEQMGFEIDEFGENTIIIRSIPALVDEGSAESFVLTAVSSSRTGENMINVFPEVTVYTMACKAAVKGNMKLSDVEIRALLDSLLAVKNPGTCPHGRPIMIKMSQYEIERRFHRA